MTLDDQIQAQLDHIKYLESVARIRRQAFEKAHRDMHEVGIVLTQARQALNDLMDARITS